jgi:serine protease
VKHPVLSITAAVVAATAAALSWPAALQAASASPTRKASAPAAPLLVGQLMIKLRAPSAVERVQALEADRMAVLSDAAGMPLTAVRAMSGDASVVRLPQLMTAAEAERVAQRLSAHADVEWASPDLPVRKYQSTPPDANYPARQWNLFPPTQVLSQTDSTGVKNYVATGGANLPGAWFQTRGAASVTVAVIDTGITLNHPDLVSNLLPGYDFVSGDALAGAPFNAPVNFVANDGNGRDADPTDPGDWITAPDVASYPALCGDTAAFSSWHGTHMAGIVAGVWTSVNPNPAGTSTAGIAPGVKILPVRALGKCAGMTSDIIDAIRWSAGITVPGVVANTNPARVINLSLGTSTGACSPAYQSAVNDALARGAVVVAATGNDAQATVGQPANCNGVIAVTAHAVNGDLGDYANIGAQSALSAPGGGGPSQLGVAPPLTASDIPYYIWSALLFGPTTPTSVFTDVAGTPCATGCSGPAIGGQSGTSAAAAHVSGVAALLISLDPTLTPSLVRAYLTQTVRPHVAGGYCAPGQPGAGLCGTGLLDASAAVNLLVRDLQPPPSSSGGGALSAWHLGVLALLALGSLLRPRRRLR